MGTGAVIRNPVVIKSILEQACAGREMLFLLTPYLRFESHFLFLEEKGFNISATMGHEDAIYGLKSMDLRIRFPHSVQFLEGQTHFLGMGLAEGRRSLRLAFPEELVEEDQRGAYRVERVGRVTVTFSTKGFNLMTGALVNLSSTGARVITTRDLGEIMKVGDEITVTIPLLEDLRINSYAKVRHVAERTFGVEFKPLLEGTLLANLARWVFQKREEDRDRIGRRPSDKPAQENDSEAPVVQGVVLVSASETLEAELRELFKAIQPLTRCQPTIQGLKEALGRKPMLILFHVPQLGLDERRRLKPMVEFLGGKLPFVVLGSSGEGSASLLEFGTELKATATYQWTSGKGLFFQRLIQGILNRHYEGREGPRVAAEPDGP